MMKKNGGGGRATNPFVRMRCVVKHDGLGKRVG